MRQYFSPQVMTGYREVFLIQEQERGGQDSVAGKEFVI